MGLSEEETVRFNSAWYDLVENLTASDVWSYLLSKSALTVNDIDIIKNQPTKQAQNEYLLNVLKRKLIRLQDLIDACKEAKYHHLTRILENGPGENPDDSSGRKGSVDSPKLYDVSISIRGKIPKRPEAYVERSEILDNIKSYLNEMGAESYQNVEHKRWLFLHGMSGCGKSVLAAECARDPSVIGSVYAHVYWLKMSARSQNSTKLNSSSSMTQNDALPNDEEILRSALNFLYGRTKTKPFYKNIDDGFEQLIEPFLTENPKTLLVLDDLVSPSHVPWFDALPCRFLVTTQNAAIVNMIPDARKFSIAINPAGFTLMETFQCFSRWLRTPVDKLPQHDVQAIHKECNGHPFVISLIGSSLRLHNNRWKLSREYLARRHLDKIKNSNPDINYPHKSFDAALDYIIDNLPTDLRKVFFDLSIIPEGVKFSAKELAVMWKMTPSEVEDLMDRLVERHLVVKLTDAPTSDCDSYVIHELVHGHIKNKTGRNTRKTLEIIQLPTEGQRNLQTNTHALRPPRSA